MAAGKENRGTARAVGDTWDEIDEAKGKLLKKRRSLTPVRAVRDGCARNNRALTVCLDRQSNHDRANRRDRDARQRENSRKRGNKKAKAGCVPVRDYRHGT